MSSGLGGHADRADPKVGLDAAPLAGRVANDQLRGALGRVGIEAEGESVEETLREGARQGLGRILRGESGSQDGTPPDGEEAEAEAGPRGELIEQGLGAIFGGRRQAEEPADEAAPEE